MQGRSFVMWDNRNVKVVGWATRPKTICRTIGKGARGNHNRTML